MGWNGKNRNPMLCSIITCGRKSKHNLKHKSYNYDKIYFLCVQCYLAYKMGKRHKNLKTEIEEVLSFKV